MSDTQLWEQCLPLTHHSLEAFLLSVIQRPLVYNLYQFLKHSQIATVDKKVLDLFKIFVSGNYSSVSESIKNQLSKEKISKLKKLTILSLFEGLKEISLRTIESEIQSSREQIIDLLIQMSISGTIDIKINQRLSKVQIHYAQIRARQFTQQDTLLLQGKVSNIITKNKSILNIIDQTYSEIKNKNQSKSEIGWKSPTHGGFRRF